LELGWNVVGSELSDFCERAPEGLTGVEPAAADGANGHAEKLGDFVVRSPANVALLDHFTLLRGQLPDGSVQHE
jgi:hypothetical protein